MSTATAGAPTTAPVKSIELFLEGVTLLRYDFGASNEPCSFIVTCPGGSLIWGEQLPVATDHNGNTIALPVIVADRMLMTYANGTIEERVCQNVQATAPTEREESSTARW